MSSRGSTIVYVGLGGELTAEIAHATDNIMKLEVLKQIKGTGTPLDAVKAEVAKSNSETDQNVVVKKEQPEVKPATDFVDAKFTTDAKKLTTTQIDQLSKEIKQEIPKKIE